VIVDIQKEKKKAKKHKEFKNVLDLFLGGENKKCA
jgi:hypothetical protein